MGIRYLLIIQFLLMAFIAQAQDIQKIDSLMNEIKTAEKDTNIVKLYLELGDKYDYNLPESVLVFYKKALTVSEEIKSKKFIAKCLNNIGVCYYYQGSYQQAVENYMRSLKIYEELGNKNGIADCYNNLGLIYDTQGSYDEALLYYLEALKIDEEFGNKYGMATSHNNIGIVYWNQGNNDKAIEHFVESLKIYKELDDKRGMADCYNNIGLFHASVNINDVALVHFIKALKIYENMNDDNGIAMSYENIAALYIKQKEYTKAVKHALKGLEIAKEINSISIQKFAYDILSTANDSLRNYKRSLEFYKLYKQISDSIFNEKKSKQITEMQIKYETEKKERENKLQELLLQKQKFYLFFMVIMSVAMMAALVLMIRSNIKTKHINWELKRAMKNIRTLSGLLPICASCKKIRGDSGYWTQVEEYISSNSDVIFSHSICPDCIKKLYPSGFKKESK